MSEERQMRRRAFGIQARAAADGVTEIFGVAIVYNTVAYDEVIRPGAFTKSMQEQDVKMYWSHNTDLVLARTGNGTLTLDDREDGLHVTARPNLETTWGRDALASIQRGDVHQFSFAFSPVKAGTIDLDSRQVYEVREARLYEVSPVAEPWYESTSASARDRATVQDLLTVPTDKQSLTVGSAEESSVVGGQAGRAAADEPEPGQEPHSTQVLRARLALRLRLAE